MWERDRPRHVSQNPPSSQRGETLQMTLVVFRLLKNHLILWSMYMALANQKAVLSRKHCRNPPSELRLMKASD